MDKRASMSTTILVVMALILVCAALFSFYNNSKEVKAELIDTYFINKVYYEEHRIENNLSLVFEQTFIANYGKAVSTSSNTLAKKLIKDEMLKAIDKSAFRYFEVEYNDELYSYAEMNEPIVGCLNDGNVWVWGEFNNSDGCKLGIIYRPKIDFALDIESLGLANIDDFFFALSNCKSNGNVEKCLEANLLAFDVEFDSESKKAKFSSKQLYFISDKLTKVEFEKNFAQDL